MSRIGLPKMNVQYAEPNCSGCHLNRAARLPMLGKGEQRILILFESQDSFNQIYKSYASGARYDYVKSILYRYGIIISRDCWVSSAIQCYAKEPDIHHVECCRPLLYRTLAVLKPRLIIGFGDLTANALLKDILETNETYLDRTHGFPINLRKFGCDAMFTYNPEQITSRGVKAHIIERDIMRAIQGLAKPYKVWKDETTCVDCLNEAEALERLTISINNPEERYEAFDYETTGLKPHNAAHRVISVGIADGENSAYAFKMTENITPVWVQYLKTPQIKKIAQNKKFEDTWSFYKFGTWVTRLTFDPMLVLHSLDNRDTGILSIKFMAPMFLGTPIWNRHVEKFFEPSESERKLHGCNAINKIDMIPTRILLTYNGIDALVELRTFYILKDWIKNYYNGFPEVDE